MRVSEENYYINPNITQESTKRQGKTIFAGDLNRPQDLFSKQGPFGNRREDDAIERRREEAVKQAVKLVTDTWAGEASVDESMAQTREQMQSLEKESAELVQARKGYQEQIAEYEGNESLTAEEKEAATASLYEAVEAADKELAGNAEAMSAGLRSLEDTKVERLKEHPMVDAVTEEKKALQAAAKDAAFSMLQEGVNNIDEKIEEVVEAAKEKKEQVDEEKKAQEARREREEARKPETGAAKETSTAQSQGTSSSKLTEQQQKVNTQLDKIRRENILTKDDMLGMLVDSRV